MTLTGRSFIGYQRGKGAISCGSGVNPATGEAFGPTTIAASEDEIKLALELADSAFSLYEKVSGHMRAAFLRSIASNIELQLEQIIELGEAEAALTKARMEVETARTAKQLRLFATMVENDQWLTHHSSLTNYSAAKSIQESSLKPLGPVLVFGASNFPLAYSVAGGDTASALAAGCPVIVKAHPAHPNLSELIANCVNQAAISHQLPEGVFSMLFGEGIALGQTLAKAPQVKAIGFTGSQTGGRALMNLAATRPQPIPVYAEMSAINPVIILDSALSLKEKSETLADQFFKSLSQGVGQFCTNPGLVFIPNKRSNNFKQRLLQHLQQSEAGVMLHSGVCDNFNKGIQRLFTTKGITPLFVQNTTGVNQAAPAVFQTSSEVFTNSLQLNQEVFGPATLLVAYEDSADLTEALESLDGQLTTSIHCSEQQLLQHQWLIDLAERRAGRIIFNGFPTGVEVCSAMVHGGPYPATSDGRSSAVGNQAIYRFTRPTAHIKGTETLS